jgi:hypothetical protein
LTGVTPQSSMASLVFAFILMGAGGMQQHRPKLCISQHRQWRYAGCQRTVEHQPPAQLFGRAALLSALLAVLQVYYPSTQAWHGVFIIAACLTLIPSGLPAP